MNFLRWFIFSNCLISCSAAFLTFGAAKFLNTSLAPVWYALFVFGSTLFTYNFQRLIKILFRHTSGLSARHFWIGTHQLPLKVLSVFGLSLAAVVYFIILFDITSFLFLLPLLLVSILYAVRFLRNKNLREIPYIKIHLIAFVWTSASVLLPALSSAHSSWFILVFTLSIYLYILAIAVPFDIRDLKFDSRNQKTFPQVLGVKRAKIVAILFALVSFVLLVTLLPAHFFQLVLLILSFVIQIVLISFSSENKGEIYFSGAIDGAILLLALSLIV